MFHKRCSLHQGDLFSLDLRRPWLGFGLAFGRGYVLRNGVLWGKDGKKGLHWYYFYNFYKQKNGASFSYTCDLFSG